MIVDSAIADSTTDNFHISGEVVSGVVEFGHRLGLNDGGVVRRFVVGWELWQYYSCMIWHGGQSKFIGGVAVLPDSEVVVMILT